MHRFDLLPSREAFVQELNVAGVPIGMIQRVNEMLFQHDRKEMNELLERRLSPTFYAYCKSQPDEPENVDEVIML
eukprot:3181576-Lingulodinium_polyedra.AAC.1